MRRIRVRRRNRPKSSAFKWLLMAGIGGLVIWKFQQVKDWVSKTFSKKVV